MDVPIEFIGARPGREDPRGALRGRARRGSRATHPKIVRARRLRRSTGPGSRASCDELERAGRGGRDARARRPPRRDRARAAVRGRAGDGRGARRDARLRDFARLASLRTGDLDREQLACLALVGGAAPLLLLHVDRVGLHVRVEPLRAERRRGVDDPRRLPVPWDAFGSSAFWLTFATTVIVFVARSYFQIRAVVPFGVRRRVVVLRARILLDQDRSSSSSRCCRACGAARRRRRLRRPSRPRRRSPTGS